MWVGGLGLYGDEFFSFAESPVALFLRFGAGFDEFKVVGFVVFGRVKNGVAGVLRCGKGFVNGVTCMLCEEMNERNSSVCRGVGAGLWSLVVVADVRVGCVWHFRAGPCFEIGFDLVGWCVFREAKESESVEGRVGLVESAFLESFKLELEFVLLLLRETVLFEV